MGRVLSLEFGNRNIKLLDGSKSGNSLTIYKSILIDVVPGSIDDGKIIDMDSVVGTINQSLNENNIRLKNAIFTVSTNSTVTRNIELPVLKSKSETMSMIKNELGQLMPVDLNQYKLIYKKTDSTNTDGAEIGKYIVYGLPGSMYEQYIELAARLKLELIALDLSYNCLDKIAEKKLSINGTNLKSGTASAFIEINYGSITFSVVNSGKNDFSRTYSNGLSDIVKSFGTVFNLSSEEALNEIEKISLSENYEINSDTAKYNIVEENVNMWIDEISRYTRYYNSANKEKQINKIYLYGRYSNIKGLPEYIESRINIDTDLIDSVSNISFKNGDENITSYFNTILSLYIDKRDISFLSDVKKQRKSSFNKGVAVFAVSTAAVLALALYGYTYYIEKTSLLNDIATYDAFLNKEENIQLNNEAIALINKNTLMEKYIAEIEKLQTAIKNEDAVTTLIFEQVANALPLGTKINSMSVDINSILLQCTSVSREEAAQFEKNLKEIEYIDNVYIPAVVDGTEGGRAAYSYSVACDLKDVITYEAE